MWRRVGIPYQHDELGWVQIEPDGKTTLLEPKAARGGDDTVGDIFDALLKINPNPLGAKTITQLATEEGGAEKVANLVVGMAEGLGQASQRIERVKEIATFVEKHRGAPDFDTIMLSMAEEDPELLELQRVFTEFQKEAVLGLDPQSEILVRAIAKRIVQKLVRVQDEIAAMGDPRLLEDYGIMVAKFVKETQ